MFQNTKGVTGDVLWFATGILGEVIDMGGAG
jgi:hypothetical protein